MQAVAKVLIVTTFMEDALRVLITFSVQQQSMRIAGWQSVRARSLSRDELRATPRGAASL